MYRSSQYLACPDEPTLQPEGFNISRVGTDRHFQLRGRGRLAEEWVRTDYRSFPTKLGVKTTERAQGGRHDARGAGPRFYENPTDGRTRGADATPYLQRGSRSTITG